MDVSDDGDWVVDHNHIRFVSWLGSYLLKMCMAYLTIFL